MGVGVKISHNGTSDLEYDGWGQLFPNLSSRANTKLFCGSVSSCGHKVRNDSTYFDSKRYVKKVPPSKSFEHLVWPSIRAQSLACLPSAHQSHYV